MPELSRLIFDRTAELRLAWRDAARADDIAVMHITAHGNAMLKAIAEWLNSGNESRLESIVASPPWTRNEAGADSPSTLLTSLIVTLQSELGSEFRGEFQRMASELALATDSAVREQVRELEERASTDALTGAMSRSAILQKLNQECARANRYGRSLSVVYCDIDGLKQVNEAHGHSAGDDLLKRMSHVIVQATRASDSFGRLGGDEFLLVLPETDAEGAQTIAVRLIGAVESQGIRVSTGIAGTPGVDAKPGALVEEADAAMRSTKASKR